jgi:hypothetical protein
MILPQLLSDEWSPIVLQSCLQTNQLHNPTQCGLDGVMMGSGLGIPGNSGDSIRGNSGDSIRNSIHKLKQKRSDSIL